MEIPEKAFWILLSMVAGMLFESCFSFYFVHERLGMLDIWHPASACSAQSADIISAGEWGPSVPSSRLVSPVAVLQGTDRRFCLGIGNGTQDHGVLLSLLIYQPLPVSETQSPSLLQQVLDVEQVYEDAVDWMHHRNESSLPTYPGDRHGRNPLVASAARTCRTLRHGKRVRSVNVTQSSSHSCLEVIDRRSDRPPAALSSTQGRATFARTARYVFALSKRSTDEN
ncbi:hypothetical protein CONLIGDRAFT_644701 [Coniochaeta ligniaria NRRL 30616]|uniref:Uncharacterized protein n=1 Tax=Coniochaeta ligniaria NRRL 30616 TaxID=1408157 RepID=A0A1J7JFN4_9PEZI|nr:hypothetical protein CONLIGDRAFT_644701 [Coniochaeta ligniaria NRRL 30616]